MTDRGSMPEPWWKEGVSFSCVRCGGCCSGEPGAVWFTEDEASAIADFLGISMDDFFGVYVWNRYGRPSLREKANYDCIFLERDGDSKKCAIYERRPSQCRTFPFWQDVLETKLSWEYYSRNCPGMNSGKFHYYDAILERLSCNKK